MTFTYVNFASASPNIGVVAQSGTSNWFATRRSDVQIVPTPPKLFIIFNVICQNISYFQQILLNNAKKLIY